MKNAKSILDTLPQNTKIYESIVSYYWFDEDGIFHSLVKEEERNLENSKLSFEVIKEITQGQKVYVLVHFSNSPEPNQKTREYISNEIPNYFHALAIIAGSRVMAVTINFILMFMKNKIPTKVFSNLEEAKDWLREIKSEVEKKSGN